MDEGKEGSEGQVPEPEWCESMVTIGGSEREEDGPPQTDGIEQCSRMEEFLPTRTSWKPPDLVCLERRQKESSWSAVERAEDGHSRQSFFDVPHEDMALF